MIKGPASPTAPQDPSDEIASLVQKLQATQQRLHDLTKGQVDAVLHPGGHAYLLHKAQMKLRQSESDQRQLAETLMALLNALPAHIALLDSRGVIISVNRAWALFSSAQAPLIPEFFVNQNYLKICEQAHGEGAEDAQAAARGIRQVLEGKENGFTLEYPCHSPSERRWFQLMVTPVRDDRLAGAVVMHIDITQRKLADEQLTWKNALFEAQVNSSLDGIIVVDSAGNRIIQNQKMIELWNIPDDIANETDHRRRLAWITSQVKNPEAFAEKVAHLYSHPDEVSRDELNLVNGKWLDRYSAPVRDAHGKHYGRIWTYRDITERKLAEEALRRQKTELQVLFDLMPAMIWFKDTENGILRVNKRAAQAAGKPVEEVEGKSMREIFPDKADQFHEYDLEVIHSQKPSLGVVSSSRGPDGRELWAQTDKVPVFDHDGKVIGIIVMTQDITEQKRIEGRFRSLVESNVHGVFFWRKDGTVSGGNNAFLNLIGYTRADLEAGRIDWVKLTPPEYAPLDRHCLDELVSQGHGTPYEKEYLRKDGSRVPILIGQAAFEDNPDEGVCFVIDLTERKKIEHQFLRAQRMESVGTLAGGIAHDLNNILAPIMMCVEVLKTTATDPQAISILETIEVSSKRGADIVRQVLSFARGMEGERIEVQPRHLLKDIETIIRDTFPKNIRQRLSCADDLSTILGDPTQLHQILLNLCVNARDAMPNGGNLTITLENCVLDEQFTVMNMEAKPGRYVLIKISDTGTGIPRDIIDKIFEPFFTTKDVHKGTGLGLSTVLAIVRSHEGTIQVESQPGKGTTFKIYLPALEVSAEEKKKKTQSVDLPRGKGETILVVDDEASVLSITSQTLQAFNYRVLTATDGADAVAVYAQNQAKIDLVLTDMMMPVMDGPSTIRALLRLNPAVKIIAASGLNASGHSTPVPESGVKHVLTKPFTSGTLLKALRAVLEQE